MKKFGFIMFLMLIVMGCSHENMRNNNMMGEVSLKS